jgi:hypothetical protein
MHPTVALQASAPDAVVDLARRRLGLAMPSASMTTQTWEGEVEDHHRGW